MEKNLYSCVKFLENNGQLIRIQERLSPFYEVAAALRYVEQKSGKAVLFEKIEGYDDVVILGNLFSKRRRLAMLMNVPEDRLIENYQQRMASFVPPRVMNAQLGDVGLTQLKKPEITALPVLTHHAKDAAPYLTSAVVIAKDPETGIRGMGIHRIQVKDKNRLGIFLGSPPISDFLVKAEATGKDLEVAIVIGIDPLTWLTSVAYAPGGVDKFGLAGALRGEPVDLVRCATVDVEVPAEAEYVIEGRVLAGIREKEGPFGESNGVYLTYENPVVQIQCISQRPHPVYHALLPFNHEESVLIGLSWETQNQRELQQRFPFVKRMHLEEDDWTKAIMQVDREQLDTPLLEFAKQILQELYFIKTLILVDKDINIYDGEEISFALGTRFQPDRDMLVVSDQPALSLDPSATISSQGYRTSKVAMDATISPAERQKYEKIAIPDSVSQKIREKLGDKYWR